MRNSIYLGLIILLFAGVNVLNFMGWGIDLKNAPFWQRILPSVYLLTPVAILYLLFTKIERYITQKKEELYLFIAIIFLVSYMQLMGQANYFATIANCLYLPVLISFLIPCNNNSHCKISVAIKLRNIIIVFFIVECGLAIFERLYHVNIFPFGSGVNNLLEEHYKTSGFRSTSLQNHPLENALSTSIIMSFIIISSIKPIFKYSLWLLGFIAILCFNTRSSMIGMGILFIVHVMYEVFVNRRISIIHKSWLLTIAIIIIMLVILLLYGYGWGNRILSMNTFTDGSASTRVKIWDVFKYYEIGNFLWGLPFKTTKLLAARVGVRIIENYWLIYIFRYGIIFTGILVLLFRLLFKKLLIGYTRYGRIIVLFSFLLISSANNSLAVVTPALTLFIVSTHAFKTKFVEKREIQL